MDSKETDQGTLETWTPEEVYHALENGEICLIDVRTPQEYMFEHVEGAMLMPMSFFRAATLPGGVGKKVVLHCGSGVRSEKCAMEALAHGYDTIAHLGGGFAAWKQSKLPYIGTEMSTGAPKKVG